MENTDNNLTHNIEQVHNLIKLKEKAEVLKLEMLTFNENKKSELMQNAEKFDFAEDLQKILETLDNDISNVYAEIKKKVEMKLGKFIV